MDSHSWIVIAEGKSKTGLQLREVFEKASLLNPVFLIPAVQELFDYLEGKGIYGNREKFPLPAILLVDWQMLGDAASERIKAIRGADHLCNLPIIVMIEPGQEKELDSAYDAGATTYLRKPFTFAEFLERSRLAHVKFVMLGGL